MSIVNSIVEPITLPRMVRIRQKFDAAAVEDIPAEVSRQLSRPEIESRIKPGMRIALAVGSRGIYKIDVIVKSLLDFFKAKGAEPFIVPAMGSHGGATAEGQAAVLANYGVTEEQMGVPVKSSMEVTAVGKTADGTVVSIDKNAFEADGIFIVNRIKPHVGFSGKYESGLMKMLTIGLGKQKGAEECHRQGFPRMGYNVEQFGRCIIENTKLIAGLAIIENAYDRTKELYALLPQEIIEQEPELKNKAKSCIPTVIPDKLDVLIVDRMGKNFGGDGMDGFATKRFIAPGMPKDPAAPSVILPLDLTEESHGNAMGIGAADVTTRRLFDKIDLEATYPNALTASIASAVTIPVVMDNDLHAIKAAIKFAYTADRQALRIVRIPNTLHIEYIEVSEALIPELRQRSDIEILSEPYEFDFNENGDLF